MTTRPDVSPLRSATRIVATLGPASARERIVRQMIQAGVDLFRFNMSHGDHESHAAMIAQVRSAAAALGSPVGILIDLQGPKIRTRANASDEHPVLRRGSIVRLAFGSGQSTSDRVVVDFPTLGRDLEVGDDVLFDDGKITAHVHAVDDDGVDVKIERGGPLKPRAGVNVPGRVLSVEIPTRKDRRDASFALEQGADFIALSFVQTAGDIARLRRVVDRRLPATKHASDPDVKRRVPPRPLIIAKLEKPRALDDLDAILEATDGVMVARGDLGVELSLEKVPLWQKTILRRARQRGRLTITATQMLESMVHSAFPTRAEVSDVSNAIFDGTDAVMLSGETATGSYPVEAVRTLSRVAQETEDEIRRTGHFRPRPAQAADALHGNPKEAIVHAAVDLAERANAKWIVVFTLRGGTVRLIARHRPDMGIIAFTPFEHVRRRLALSWNTRTIPLSVTDDTYRMMNDGVSELRRARLVRSGDSIVIVAGDAPQVEASNLLRLVKIG